MNATIILPAVPEFLEKFGNKTKHHLILPQLVEKYPAYADFYRARTQEGHHVILDNGAAEGVTYDPAVLVDMAVDLRVTEVVAPDILRSNLSLNQTQSFIVNYFRRLRAAGINIMGVPQGSTFEDWWESYHKLTHMSEISVIGIGKIVSSLCDSRGVALGLISRMHEPPKPVHLLGMDRWIPEAFWWGRSRWVRSIDSNYWLSIAGLGFELTQFEWRKSDAPVIHTPEDLDKPLPSHFRELAEINFQQFQELCRV